MADFVELKRLAVGVCLIALDVDGVLTDGTFLWDLAGGEQKRFCFADVMGLSLARKAGIRLALVSGEANAIIDRLAGKLHIPDVYQGVRDKAECMRKLIRKHRLSRAQVCYVGDDVNDVPVLRMVGLPVAVPNAHASVFPHVRWVTRRRGGEGAVREITDLIVQARSLGKDVSVA